MLDLDDSWIAVWGARGGDMASMVRLFLLQADLNGLRLALEDFESARAALATPNALPRDLRRRAMDRLFYSAKNFVTGLRRFARLLEATVAHKHEYPKNVSETIAICWRKRHDQFYRYKDPRDAVEHIDGEVTGQNHRFINVWGDELEVVDGQKVPINAAALELAEATWREISVQLRRADDALNPYSAQRQFVLVLAARMDDLVTREVAA
jgi:hypothetical protein